MARRSDLQTGADKEGIGSCASWQVAGVCLFVFALFSLRVLWSHNWNPEAFILRTPADVPPGQNWGVGYDGRFSYAIAAYPWGSTRDLDQPAFRYQRILYPLLVKILSAGSVQAVPWMMLLVNLLASAAVCWLLGELLRRRGASPWVALACLFSVGFLIAVRMDLLEPLALAFGLGAWLALENRRTTLALVLLAVGALAKEIVLVFTAAWCLWLLLQGGHRKAATVAAAGFLPYAAWYLVLRAWFGPSAEALAKSRLSPVPFLGMRFLPDPASAAVVAVFVVGPAAVLGLVAFRDLWRHARSERGRDALLVLGQAGLISILPQASWVDPIAILRFGLGLAAAAILWVAGSRPRLLPFLVALWGCSGLILFTVPGMF